jgi:hypothetical protein
MRCDSKLHGLSIEQRVKVDAWLFDEGRTYEEVIAGCFREFGLEVSKSSVGRYYERVSANRFAKIQREKRMALEPKLSPAEAYKELLRRIAELAWEEMDQPLGDINHKVVVRLVRVLIAARREKHMETRVWVERRKVENWLARECLRHWRREVKKKAHVSYLPILRERKVTLLSDSKPDLNRHTPHPGPLPVEGRGGCTLPLPRCVTERGRNASENYVAPVALGRRLIQANATEDSTLKRHECRAPGRDARDHQWMNEAK